MLLNQLAQLLPATQLIATPQGMLPYVTDHRNKRVGQALAVVCPSSVAQVQAIVRLCAAQGVPMVPQGGNTGHMSGQIPDDTGRAVVISLQNMNQLRDIHAYDGVLRCDAGMTLQNVRAAAAQAGWLFPLSIPSQGSAQVGGLISTNAGGTAVYKYGQMRALTLGVEVVLPNGDLYSRLSTVRKDNAGYALPQYFIGAEGTLGIITGAALRLLPPPLQQNVAMVGINDLEQFLPLLAFIEQHSGQALTSCELLSHAALELVHTQYAHLARPFATPSPWNLLLEASFWHASQEAVFADVLLQALDKGLVHNAVLASNTRQQQAMQQLRELVPEAQKHQGASLKHDISVPRNTLPQFVQQVTAQVQALLPSIRPIIFGHIADGNLHYNFSVPEGMSAANFAAYAASIQTMVHNAVQELGGSIAAEHGIGRTKAHELAQRLDPVALQLMHSVKNAIDPQGVMNPRCVLV